MVLFCPTLPTLMSELLHNHFATQNSSLTEELTFRSPTCVMHNRLFPECISRKNLPFRIEPLYSRTDIEQEALHAGKKEKKMTGVKNT